MRELLARTTSGSGLRTVTELSGVAPLTPAAAPSRTGTARRRHPGPAVLRGRQASEAGSPLPLAEGERYGGARRSQWGAKPSLQNSMRCWNWSSDKPRSRFSAESIPAQRLHLRTLFSAHADLRLHVTQPLPLPRVEPRPERRYSRTALRCSADPGRVIAANGPRGRGRRRGRHGAIPAPRPMTARSRPARSAPPCARRCRHGVTRGLGAGRAAARLLLLLLLTASSRAPRAGQQRPALGRPRWGSRPVPFRSVLGRRCAAYGVAAQLRACPAGRGVDGAPARYVLAARTGGGRRSVSRSRGRDRDRGWGGRSVKLRGARHEGEAGRQRLSASGRRVPAETGGGGEPRSGPAVRATGVTGSGAWGR